MVGPWRTIGAASSLAAGWRGCNRRSHGAGSSRTRGGRVGAGIGRLGHRISTRGSKSAVLLPSGLLPPPRLQQQVRRIKLPTRSRHISQVAVLGIQEQGNHAQSEGTEEDRCGAGHSSFGAASCDYRHDGKRHKRDGRPCLWPHWCGRLPSLASLARPLCIRYIETSAYGPYPAVVA